MPLKKHKRNSDGTYGPSSRGDFYLSKADHRRTAKTKKGKTKWEIEEGEEFSVFLETNEPYWYCSENNCLFALMDNCTEVLGENGERIAKFPNDRNKQDPWHGYPVMTQEKQNRPSSDLLDIIEESGSLDIKVRIKIEKGLL